jgi:DNA-binding Lrp family transcriptional regulator
MDGVDEKLLYYLDVNARMPVKKIASLIGEKSEKVNYRLKRLFQDKIVTRCFAEVNPWKTGYSSFKVYFQFQGVDKNKINEMYEFLLQNCNVGWVASCLGRWDMVVEILARDRYEFMKFYRRFHRKYYECILYKVVGVTLERIFLNKKWLAPQMSQVSASYMSGEPKKAIDSKDFIILRHLITNGRDSVKKMSDALGMPPTTISQRMNNLIKKEIITNFRIDVDLAKFNRIYCKAFIYFSEADEEEQKQLIEFCYNHPDIIYLTKTITPWDMEIEGQSSSFNEFTELINQLRNKYPGIIRNFEAVVINQETGASHIPRKDPDKQ